MIMDVSLAQNPTDIYQSSIRKELRQRKYLVTNQQIQEIKPFKTYRKPNNHHDAPQLKDTHQSQLQGHSPQSLQLKRQYPTPPFLANDQRIALKQTKYKYDVDPINCENQPPVDVIAQSHNKKFSDIPKNSQVRVPMLKKNIKCLHDPFVVGASGGRKEVQSIIFDSKVTKLQEADVKELRIFTIGEQITNDQNIKVFQEKVDQVNNEIEAGLSNLQKMIGQLKKKKIAQSQIQTQLKVKSRLQELQRQFAQRRAECKQKEKVIDKPLQSPSVQADKNIKKQLIENLIDNEAKLKASLDKAASPPKSKDQGVADSQIQLLGGINSKSNNFPPQYISFINRLATQIEKDIQFTNKITELTKSNHIQAIRSMILQEIAKRKSQELIIDQTFLQLEPSEIDPLDQGKPGWYKAFSTEALEKEALTIYKMYRDIQHNFQMKLYKKFSSSVLKLLFEELAQFNFTKSALNDSDSVTVGHLLSYLNMRTNNSFRNRSFVKMLKRLGLRPNSFLTINSFEKLIIY